MNDIERAIVRLTEEHTELIDGQAAVSDPLLMMLWAARYPDLGRTVGGAGTGMPFDAHAIELYEYIDGVVRAWLNHFREHATGELMPLVKKLYEVIQAEDAGERLEDRERMYGMFQQFVTKIEDKFDPPHEYELTGTCPECEHTHAGDEEGQYKRAVRVVVRPGHALVAECHKCGKLWAGQSALTELAETIGAEVDWVALRELVDTRKETTAV